MFGQAGFLSAEIPNDEYFAALKNEYHFLQHKFNLQPIEKHLWKFLRLRPVNFPTIRIAQLAQLIHQSSGLFSKIVEAETIAALQTLFNKETSIYWEKHYQFGKESKQLAKSMGTDFINLLITNVVVPILFVYGRKKNREEVSEKALNFLENLPAEKNSILKNWQQAGITAENTFQSQALIELKNEFCEKHQCLDCSIGNQIIFKQQQ